MYPEAAIHHLAHTHSNHYPVLLKMDDHGPSSLCRPFLFQPMWMSHPLFLEVVADSWTEEGPLKLNVEKFTVDVKFWRYLPKKKKKELRLDSKEFKLELLKGQIVIS